MENINKKLILGISGGVDSATAAFLAVKAGYDVLGVTHAVTDQGFTEAENAKKLCTEMGLSHITLDLREEFKAEVIEYFVKAYKKGLTPNPCVMCNKKVKFPYLFNMAEEDDFVATGHYAIIEKAGDGHILKKGIDRKKDQSYMLWALPRESLSRLVFPLGKMTKEEVRTVASESGLPVAEKKDSQDICFIPDGDYVRFMKEYLGVSDFPSGNYVDISGNLLGTHSGHLCYTPGQSRGLGIALGKKVFVVSKNASSNTVVLGDKCHVMKKEVKATNINFLTGDDLSKPQTLEAKIRYSGPASPAEIFRSGEDEITAVFKEEVSAPAPGQSLVIYDGDTVVAGGEITL